MQASPSSQAGLPLPETLLALAPLRLPNHRRERYVGDDLCVELDRLATRDQTLLRDLYRRLSELLFTIADPATTDAQKWEGIEGWIDRHDLDAVIEDVREIGQASYELDPGEKLAKAMHDARGGALSSLLGRLQMLGHLHARPPVLNTLFVQVRDHLKIMRSALVGLDEERREADREPKAHVMKLMLEKWHQSVVGPNWQQRPIRMHIDCRYEGALTECCLESAAMDRIFYNLANNACRHAATERLDMTIFPVPDASGSCLRFVLSNEVNDKDAAYLRSITEGSQTHGSDRDREAPLLPLFTPRVSTTGSGFGLTVVADFVAGAFGLRDRVQALRERYVGAMLEDHTFRLWFHWPVGNSGLPPKKDDYHDPAHSLSEP